MRPVGIALSTYVHPLHAVDAQHDKAPSNTFPAFSIVHQTASRYIEARWGDDYDEETVLRCLPLRAFRDLTFDQLCKVKFSSTIMMDNSVEKAFDEDVEYRIVRKIMLSMWHWGAHNESWNEIVDAYDGIRRFAFDVPDFEVRLDYTSYVNEKGLSEFSRTFLDGEFAFLIHYRGQHVMTVGFSFAGRNRILIQQIQTVERRGNRFLFKLPSNYVEFVVERFAEAFPNHTLCMADGEEFAKLNISSYKKGLKNVQERIERVENGKSPSIYARQYLSEYREEALRFSEKITHLEGDLPRLKALYAKTGRFQRGTVIRARNMKHYILKPRKGAIPASA